jgi:methyl-accepting chemotaxis protein
MMFLAGFYSVCLLAIGVVMVTSIGEFFTDYKKNAETFDANMRSLSKMGAQVEQLRTQALSLMGADKNPKQVAQVLLSIRDLETQTGKDKAYYETIPFGEGEEAIYAKGSGRWKAASDGIDILIKGDSNQISLTPGMVRSLIMDQLDGPLREFQEAIQATKLQMLKNFDRHNAQFDQKQKGIFHLFGTLDAICIVVGLLMALFISSNLMRSVKTVVAKLQNISQDIRRHAGELTVSAESLSESSTQQSASLLATSSSLNQISHMVSKSTDGAKNAASSSVQSHKSAEEGKLAVTDMLSSMKLIHDSNDAIMAQIQQSNRKMEEVVKVIVQIGTKTQVINDIVFQTKLLSFNASVEATRAGEHGKGFAVVAREIGALAHTSGSAADDISKMLQGSIGNVGGLVAEMQKKVETLTLDGKRRVQSGVEIARHCADVLEHIVDDSGKVATLAQEISSASYQQSIGVTEINRSMSQMDIVVRQNAEASGQIRAASESLATELGKLDFALGILNTHIIGSWAADQAKKAA